MHNTTITIAIVVLVIASITIIAVINQAESEPITQENFFSTNLFDANMNLPDEISYVNKILDPIDLDCYAVAWYNATENGQAIIFMDAFKEIEKSMPSEQSSFKFLENILVRKYLEINCLHLHMITDLPENYDPNIGMLPQFACLEFNSLEWCENSTRRTLDKELIADFIAEIESNIENDNTDWLTMEQTPER